MAEAYTRFDVEAAFIRTAMVLRLVHTRENGTIDLTPTTRIEYSGYAAHRRYRSRKIQIILRSSHPMDPMRCRHKLLVIETGIAL